MGMSDPWAGGWYCWACGPVGSTMDKRPVRLPERTIVDGKWVFTCPRHGKIEPRWPNG